MLVTKRKFPLFTLLPLVVLGCVGFSQDQKPKQAKEQTFHVQVDMVSLPVVVTTRDGRRVTDLQPSDFEVFEDKVPQQITGFAATEEPISVALALDTSGSMEKRLVRVQNEAIRFVNLLHPDDSVAIMSFADDVNLLEDFSINRKLNEYGIKETRSEGWTAIYEAVWLALEEVLKPVKERTALVLFTDGVDTASHKASEKETLRLAQESRSPIYSIYFNTERDMRSSGTPGIIGGFPRTYPPVIGAPGPPGSTSAEYMAGREYVAKLAENSGGRLFEALKTDDLGPAFEEIAQELSSQYSLGYYSSNTKHDGKFRNIEVRVRKPGLAVRTKKGYFAPKAAKG